MKAKEYAKDEAYNAFMGAAPRRRAFQTSSDLSIIASSDSDYDSEESDSFDDSDSRDDESDEEEEDEEDEVEEEEEDMVLDYP